MFRRTVVFAAVSAIVALANVPALRALYLYSRSDETASHLVLIPFITCGLVLLRRRTIFAFVETSWRVGSALLFAGAVLWMLASPHRVPLDQKAALIPVVASLVVLWIGAFVLFYGIRASRAALFPLLFLSLMVPMPDAVLNRSIELLKNGSTETVAWLFTLTGTPYLREGYTFALPSRAIEVADACSGIRSTIALMITILVGGHVFLQTTWKKAVLLLVMLPITILKNAVRIVTLSLLAIHVDPAYLSGQLHHDGGIVFFLFALALLTPVLLFLRRGSAPATLSYTADVS